jgi:ribonucleotide monophosphatase NagD (HAD superfamily)
MVGDRVYTDILMAQKAQVLSVLVLSGESTLADGEAMEQHPDLILENIKDLGDMLIESNKFVSKSLV